MEVKRASEVVLCALLQEAIPTIAFYPAEGGGDDLTPPWEASHDYAQGDLLRPTSTAKKHSLIVTSAGTSGSTEPVFNDVIGSVTTEPGGLEYETLLTLAAPDAVLYPPFAVVAADKSTLLLGDSTSVVEGNIKWVNRSNASDEITHADGFRRIYNAVNAIGRGLDDPRNLIVHGIGITSTEDFTDDARRARGDVLSFVMGVTETE